MQTVEEIATEIADNIPEHPLHDKMIDGDWLIARIAAALASYGAACAALERERCIALVPLIGTAHEYSASEHANGFAAADVVSRIVAALGDPPNSPIPAATLAAMRHLARFVLDDVTQQLPVGVIAAADHLYCLARDQPGA